LQRKKFDEYKKNEAKEDTDFDEVALIALASAKKRKTKR
jgi:hypothetical protein